MQLNRPARRRRRAGRVVRIGWLVELQRGRQPHRAAQGVATTAGRTSYRLWCFLAGSTGYLFFTHNFGPPYPGYMPVFSGVLPEISEPLWPGFPGFFRKFQSRPAGFVPAFPLASGWVSAPMHAHARVKKKAPEGALELERGSDRVQLRRRLIPVTG